ncbi:unnamed protein product [Adineta ricciae]|uniref:Cyclin-like domain-containing protein n=1 Tax=Adineta ricciae TaxID=249248 RepID=A0A816CPE7_ADIRI|nr:unnamed protein product [Adineta ricciae]
MQSYGTHGKFHIDSLLFDSAWRIINDSLKTDAPLLYPPYEIALACLLLAATYCDKIAMLKQYMIDAQIDLERIYEVVKMLLKHYELMTTYDADLPNHDGRQMKELFAKFPKPKLSDMNSFCIDFGTCHFLISK